MVFSKNAGKLSDADPEAGPDPGAGAGLEDVDMLMDF